MSIQIQPRQAVTFDQAVTFGKRRSRTQPTRPTRPNTRPNNSLPVSITPLIMLSTLTVLTGCHRPANSNLTNEANSSTAITHASEHPTLPSMATYTLEQTRGKQAGGPPSSRQNAGVTLLPGEYCFHKESADNWLSIRLALSDDQRINGESAGTITHPEQGATGYKQSFSGTLTKNQALVNVTTNIDGLTQDRQEAWAINTTTLDMGRVSINGTPCLEIANNFQ